MFCRAATQSVVHGESDKATPVVKTYIYGRAGLRGYETLLNGGVSDLRQRKEENKSAAL